jgi:hypothetical protein
MLMVITALPSRQVFKTRRLFFWRGTPVGEEKSRSSAGNWSPQYYIQSNNL